MAATISTARPPTVRRRAAAAASAVLLTAAWLPAVEADRAQAATPVALSMFTEQLPVPQVLDLTAPGSSTALSAVAGTHTYHASLPPTPSWGYVPTGSSPPDVYLGPTLEVRRGNPVSVTVTNALTGTHPLASVIDTTLHGVSELDKTAPRIVAHLHGGHTPPAFDGGPDDTFRPAGTALPPGEVDFAGGDGVYTYEYPNDQEAATLWYHDHAIGITRLNVMAGLAGFYLVRDDYDTGDADNPLGLPTGDLEVPLVLQDRSFNADGTLQYGVGPWFTPDCATNPVPDTPCQWLPEFFGDVATVNGKAWPNHDVVRDVYRFRVLNGSNARVYDLKLQAPPDVTNAVMYQIGTDGGLMNAPVATNRLLLAPGERADVLVDFRAVPAGTKIVMANKAPTPFPNGPRAARLGGAPLDQIMQFTVGAGTGTTGTVPATLRGGPGQPAALPALTPVRTRTVALNEIMGTDPAGQPAPLTALLNNLHYAETAAPGNEQLMERPSLNTVEEWQIVNTTGDTHPIHLHLTQFRVQDRQRIDAAAYLASWNPMLPMPAAQGMGPVPVPDPTPFLRGKAKAPDILEAGWKDTVQANPGEVTRILVPFGGTAAGVPSAFTGDAAEAPVQRFVGRYVWHCHILDHEDNDMMLPYQVVAP